MEDRKWEIERQQQQNPPHPWPISGLNAEKIEIWNENSPSRCCCAVQYLNCHYTEQTKDGQSES